MWDLPFYVPFLPVRLFLRRLISRLRRRSKSEFGIPTASVLVLLSTTSTTDGTLSTRMSKLFKKTFRRVSWLNGGTPQYPHGGPEVPNEHSQSFDNLGANGSSRLNGRNVNGIHSGSSRAASHPTVLGTLGEFQAELPEAEDSTSEPITLAIIGAGQRGKVCIHMLF